MLFEFVLFFIFGTIVGSFLNVVVLRYEKGEQAVKGRSHCMHCRHVLEWYELIPIISFVLQRGKCRSCNTKLSVQYPLVEFGTGIVFALVLYHNFPFSNAFSFTIFTLLGQLITWSLFMVITVYDFRTKLIPDRFSFTLAGVAVLLLFVGENSFLLPTIWQLLAGPLLFLPFYILWKISNGRWLGLGDGKLALGIGWFLGLQEGGTAILFAFWIGAGVSLLLIFWQKMSRHSTSESNSKKASGQTLTLKSEIPFGPFLVLGTLLVYVLHLNMYTYLL